MKPFISKTQVHVRFRDLDAFNHVNSAVYSTYFELCRMDYFVQSMGSRPDFSDTSFVVAKQTIEYKEQIILEDIVYGNVWVSRIGSKSFDMSFSINKVDGNGEAREVAKGEGAFVCIDLKSQQTVLVPDSWRNSFFIKE